MKKGLLSLMMIFSVVIGGCGSGGGGVAGGYDRLVTTAADLNNGSADETHGMAVQQDGKIIVVGSSYKDPATRFGLIRYNASGNPDTTFGTNGSVVTDITGDGLGNWETANAAAVQQDGKIVVAGEVEKDGSGTVMAVVRYDPNGTLDTEFGTGGIVITEIDGWPYTTPTAVAMQGDKILVAALVGSGAGVDFGLARYNSDGSLDTSFGTNGILITDTTGINKYDAPYALAIDSDGKIVVAGFGEYYNAGYDNYYPQVVVVRYNADGTPDSGFGDSGIAMGRFYGGRDDRAYAMAIQPDGKIVVAGVSEDNSPDRMAAARLNGDGTLDTSFGTDGALVIDGLSSRGARAAALQPDGKIILAADTPQDKSYSPVAARLLSSGALDTGFDDDGILVVSSIESGEGATSGVTVQADGRIAIATTKQTSSESDFALIRYRP